MTWMKKLSRKKIAILIGSAILIVIALAVAGKLIPFNKILRVRAVEEAEYINQPQTMSNSPNALSFDFEVDPNTGNTSGLYKGIAHSGSFSAKVFGKNTYSQAIERKAGDVGLQNLDAVGMSTWVYIFPTSNEVTGAYVFSMNNDLGVNVCWKSVPVSGTDLPMGKWFKISGLFDLSGIAMKENFKIQVYFWNNSGCDILVDDFYIVLGAQKPRRGDSTLTDMTRGTGFLPRFNVPPFPVDLIKRQEINNRNSVFLVQNADLHEGEIDPYDTVFVGNFTGNAEKQDDLLVVAKNGPPGLYHFCPDQHKFTGITTNISPEFIAAIRKGKAVAGRFAGSGASQIMVLANGELQLGSFEPLKDLCTPGSVRQANFKLLWKISANNVISFVPLEGSEILAADVDGDGISELLIVGQNGVWALAKVGTSGASPMNMIASGPENSIPEWNIKNKEWTIKAEKFLNNYDKDVILTLFTTSDKLKYGYSLRRFDAGSRKFLPVYPEKQQFSGKTIGLDTLKPGNAFFVIELAGKKKMLRYNREWRYDLKEIEFNDITFRILANIDFTGYEKDQNPKYFEVLRIIPGKFLDKGTTSLMIIGRNCKTRDTSTNRCTGFRNIPFLPNTLQFYSFSEPKK
jgi:hypothetical protein